MPDDILLTAALSSLIMVCGAAYLLLGGRARQLASARRLQLIESSTGQPEKLSRALSLSSDAALTRGPTGGMSRPELREISRLFRRLGAPMRFAPAAYIWLKISAALIPGLVGFTMIRVGIAHPPPTIIALAAAALSVIGWFAPGVILQRLAARHTKLAADALPEALELLVVCVESGLSLEDAIDRITVELEWTRPALAEELMLTSADLKILPDRDQALANLATRIDTPSIRSVVTALTQTLRYGTQLAQALRTTAAELRNDALLQMEERANKLPTLLTIPLILFIMPTIFFLVGGPAALRLIDSLAH
jgi:tight adherence protein C